MAREGTRSATGNSKPRVFQTIDTEPTIKRTTKPKTEKEPVAAKVKAAKPAGVTKKKAPAAKKEGVGAKVKAAVGKATGKAEKAEPKAKKDTKVKTAAK
ncbi:hypothetical protein BJ170DRAFT_286043 [Xylariales sp. AK1849]|nr:hypothetical protein BJ170DRAFT_286043 [Xylariales sp. AK1849]